MAASNTNLSMRFREKRDDVVYFDATASDKEALLEFLDASIEDLDVNRVEMSTIGADIETLGQMHAIISESAGNDEPVAMPRALFADMASAARAWRSNGFDLAGPDEQDKLRASKQTVDTIIEMHTDACEM